MRIVGAQAFQDGVEREHAWCGADHASVKLGDVQQAVEQVFHGLGRGRDALDKLAGVRAVLLA